jgi:Transposase IS4
VTCSTLFTFSKQSDQGGVSSERHRWQLVDDFVSSINAHREAHLQPSEVLCADESMSKWNGLGGHWIDIELPKYIAIDRKPENGCEIQNTACGRSGIMLRLQLVTTPEDRKEGELESEGDLLHRTAVLSRLVSSWAGSGRIVTADSYFSSVEAALNLRGLGLKYVDVVKTATRRFPKAYLGQRTLQNRGERLSLAHDNHNGEIDMMAMLWWDRERRYFICTTSSAADGEAYQRVRWRQTPQGAQRVSLEVPQPKAAELYYSSCTRIDQHNRCPQDDLQLERKYVMTSWSMRVNMTLLGIIIVDSWLLCPGARGANAGLQSDLYEELATDLVFNNYDSVGLRRRASESLEGDTACHPTAGIGCHLTPTRKFKRLKTGQGTSYRVQRDCKVCKQIRSTQVCFECRDVDQTESFLCDSSRGRVFFARHVKEKHAEK